ncbi:hypothetical protein ACVCH0_06180 [Burkholderia glumae]|uniref:hypothetical protein n=1 Tax=Burkholderia glumae TaxID=337 RepID=UPI0019172836
MTFDRAAAMLCCSCIWADASVIWFIWSLMPCICASVDAALAPPEAAAAAPPMALPAVLAMLEAPPKTLLAVLMGFAIVCYLAL